MRYECVLYIYRGVEEKEESITKYLRDEFESLKDPFHLSCHWMRCSTPASP